jgi:hypothetical protein
VLDRSSLTARSEPSAGVRFDEGAVRGAVFAFDHAAKVGLEDHGAVAGAEAPSLPVLRICNAEAIDCGSSGFFSFACDLLREIEVVAAVAVFSEDRWKDLVGVLADGFADAADDRRMIWGRISSSSAGLASE